MCREKCKHPKRLRGRRPGECSEEQKRKCHGEEKEHCCEQDNKEQNCCQE